MDMSDATNVLPTSNRPPRMAADRAMAMQIQSQLDSQASSDEDKDNSGSDVDDVIEISSSSVQEPRVCPAFAALYNQEHLERFRANKVANRQCIALLNKWAILTGNKSFIREIRETKTSRLQLMFFCDGVSEDYIARICPAVLAQDVRRVCTVFFTVDFSYNEEEEEWNSRQPPAPRVLGTAWDVFYLTVTEMAPDWTFVMSLLQQQEARKHFAARFRMAVKIASKEYSENGYPSWMVALKMSRMGPLPGGGKDGLFDLAHYLSQIQLPPQIRPSSSSEIELPSAFRSLEAGARMSPIPREDEEEEENDDRSSSSSSTSLQEQVQAMSFSAAQAAFSTGVEQNIPGRVCFGVTEVLPPAVDLSISSVEELQKEEPQPMADGMVDASSLL